MSHKKLAMFVHSKLCLRASTSQNSIYAARNVTVQSPVSMTQDLNQRDVGHLLPSTETHMVPAAPCI